MSVPDRWATAKRIGACFICLNISHRAADCRKRTRCSEEGCNRSHHTLLHASRDAESNTQTKSGQCLLASTSNKPVRLGIVPVGVVTSRGIVSALAFLDSGSDTTLVKETFAQRHQLAATPSSITISTVNSTRVVVAKRIKLELTPLEGGRPLEVADAYTVSDLPMRAARSLKTLSERWSHLRAVPFMEHNSTEVDILIGCDIPEAHWVLDQILGGRTEPFAARTVFGWTLFGPLNTQSGNLPSINCMNVTIGELEENFRRLYDAEFSDTASDQKALSIEDKEALATVSDQTRWVDGRFEIPLPWRKGTDHLPDNRLLAQRRLESLKARLNRDVDLRRRYAETMQRNIDLGYCEKVEDNMMRPGRTWFLPHHPVINPKKPEKTRVVFDCAARFQGASLNDRLLQGPDWTTPLIDVLCRFRLGLVAVAADIREMFMQVKVPVQHRDALRFLWWTDGEPDSDGENDDLNGNESRQDGYGDGEK